MAVYEIPLKPQQPMRFRVTLNSISYTMRIFWNKPLSCWVLNIRDQYNNPLLEGIPMLTGTDLLEQYQYLIPGSLYVVSDHGPADIVPNFDELGVTGHLYYMTPS